eukprot:gene21680-biopygen22191
MLVALCDVVGATGVTNPPVPLTPISMSKLHVPGVTGHWRGRGAGYWQILAWVARERRAWCGCGAGLACDPRQGVASGSRATAGWRRQARRRRRRQRPDAARGWPRRVGHVRPPHLRAQSSVGMLWSPAAHRPTTLPPPPTQAFARSVHILQWSVHALGR